MKIRLLNSILFLGEQFLKINELWLNTSSYEKINLKNNLVRDIYDKNLIENIRDYQSFLVNATIKLNLELEKEYNVFNRVKTPNSIENKIKVYNSPAHEYGKVAICKCLNDLFGARIILDNELSYGEIRDFIKNEIDLNKNNIDLKCIDSSKSGYKATHVYFKKDKDNSSFQWELQIWAAKDSNNNILSHEKYKQSYTKWENERTRKE